MSGSSESSPTPKRHKKRTKRRNRSPSRSSSSSCTTRKSSRHPLNVRKSPYISRPGQAHKQRLYSNQGNDSASLKGRGLIESEGQKTLSSGRSLSSCSSRSDVSISSSTSTLSRRPPKISKNRSKRTQSSDSSILSSSSSSFQKQSRHESRKEFQGHRRFTTSQSSSSSCEAYTKSRRAEKRRRSPNSCSPEFSRVKRSKSIEISSSGSSPFKSTVRRKLHGSHNCPHSAKNGASDRDSFLNSSKVSKRLMSSYKPDLSADSVFADVGLHVSQTPRNVSHRVVNCDDDKDDDDFYKERPWLQSANTHIKVKMSRHQSSSKLRISTPESKAGIINFEALKKKRSSSTPRQYRNTLTPEIQSEKLETCPATKQLVVDLHKGTDSDSSIYETPKKSTYFLDRNRFQNSIGYTPGTPKLCSKSTPRQNRKKFSSGTKSEKLEECTETKRILGEDPHKETGLDSCKYETPKKSTYYVDQNKFQNSIGCTPQTPRFRWPSMASAPMNKTWAADLFSRSQTYYHKFIDSHCHIDYLYKRMGVASTTLYRKFMSDHAYSYPANYEGCVAVFCNPKTFDWYHPHHQILNTVADDKGVWLAVGCHPKSATEFKSSHEKGLRKILMHPKCVALGEIGLDYSGRFHMNADVQKQVLVTQLKLAIELDFPLVIHCRDADDDCLEIMTKYVPREYKIHLHCFTRGPDTAERWMDAFPNLFIGLTPVITYRSAWEPVLVARTISLDRLLLETDAPYFVPSHVDSSTVKFSHPGFALFTAEKIAEIRGVSVDEVLKACRENTRRMYGI
ncbi:3'-5' ssDNA/RNA exonuclease tatd [Plakobranchus ocellatus]|uniref:3'-5' ssDNA/RNA exonuclease tatd n=1 Tax=Plakobranchus ocellatus TaxID=259542 RepID=A0AAV4BK62_9GAST|nr:3'-5' ssDNA/RNA exonuclease tatd [Plakobranchus ocellatus]